MPPLRLSSFLLAGLGLLAGCTTGSYSVRVPIAGGGTVPIELSRNGPVHAENDDVRIVSAILQIDGKTMLGTYIFDLRMKRGPAPRSVKVEDVSDEDPLTWVDDARPRLASGHWTGRGAPIPPDQQNAKWLYEIENSIRIFKFTIVTADGRTLQLYEGTSYPSYLKEFLRKQIGAEPVPGARPGPAQ